MSRWHGIPRAIAIGFAVGCGDASTEPRPSVERLKVITSPVTTDTVEAEPVQAIVVEVRTATGAAESGILVRFEALPTDPESYLPSMSVRPVDGSGFGQFASATSDARGLAEVQIRYGAIAGIGRIVLGVPELGIADTLSFTVKPGALTAVRIAPKDTAIHVATQAHFRASALDRFGNARNDPVNFSVTTDPTGIGSVSSSGSVVATGVGTMTVVVGSSAVADTAHVTSVPAGQLAAYNNEAFLVADLDGTIVKPQFGPSYPNGFEPAWTADGLAIVIAPFGQAAMEILHLDGQSEVLSWTPGNGLGDANWPAVSSDGQYIYFSSDGIWRITRDGTRTELVHAGPEIRPSVSPDGQAVTFQTEGVYGGTAVIRSYDIRAQRFLGPDVAGHFPEWGPGASGIAFLDNATNRIKLMAPDGTGVRFLTPPDHQYFDDQLAWSPDGQWILARGAPSLELINVATGQILPLSWSANLYEPTWRPGSGQAAERGSAR
jgi:hypothetical protein